METVRYFMWIFYNFQLFHNKRMKSFWPAQWLTCKILGTGLPDLPEVWSTTQVSRISSPRKFLKCWKELNKFIFLLKIIISWLQYLPAPLHHLKIIHLLVKIEVWDFENVCDFSPTVQITDLKLYFVLIL